MIRQELFLDDFAFEAGGRLDRVKVVYHTSPERRGRVVWICHALTANSDPEDWWPEMVGAGKFFDTERDYIVCVNMLASPYGSSGPASVDPVTGRPYFFDFPAVTVRDMVAAMTAVRRELAIERIDLLRGCNRASLRSYLVTCVRNEAIDRMRRANRLRALDDDGDRLRQVPDEAPHADQTELSVAEWVDRKDIPNRDDGFSLTSEMIEYFRVNGRGEY